MKPSIRSILVVAGVCVTASSAAQRMMPVGSGMHSPGFGVFGLEEYQGQLIIAGWFFSFNGHERPHIQGWDGVQHYDLPGAFEETSNSVRALKLFGGDLIAAGLEPTIDHIARWNGSVWSPMGQGLSQRVNALTIFNGDLYAAGQDSLVSRWTGTAWVPVGTRFNQAVNALEVHGGVLYAGGRFTATADGSQTLSRIAQWNGSQWGSVAQGFNEEVLCLKSDWSGLLIGGDFDHTSDSTMQFHGCARFADGSIQPIPGVTSGGGVTGFHRMPDGRLFLGNAEMNGVAFDLQGLRVIREYQGNTYAGGAGGSLRCYRTTGPFARMVEGTTVADLDINNIRATIGPVPMGLNKWWGSARAGFEVPKGQGVHAVFGSSPWLAVSENGVVHASLPLFSNETVEWPEVPWAGPQARTMDDAFYERYHRVWELDRAMVQHHIAEWNTPGYVMAEAIASWPGNGDVLNDEPARLGPFADLDGDGSYEPEVGEYPVIKGENAVYSIQHTVFSPWTEFEPNMEAALPFDVHVMFYSEAVGDPALQHTVFVNYQFINRSDVTFDSLRFGQFSDLDIGCSNDDSAGCDSTRSMYFAYNRQDVDGDCVGTPGYGEQPPAMGVKFLSSAMRSHSVLTSNSGLEDIMYGLAQGEPFMQLGYPTHFAYPGGAWVDEVITPATPDRKAVGATGPFTLAPGDTLCIDLAFIYARATSGGAYASVEALKLRADSVQAFYDAQGLACAGYPEMVGAPEHGKPVAFRIWPNPAQDQVMIQSDVPLGLVSLIDAQGRLVRTMATTASELVLATNDLQAGLYFVQVRNETIRTERLVVE